MRGMIRMLIMQPDCFTEQMACKWIKNMEYADGAYYPSGKWTIEDIKPYADKYGIEDTEELNEFHASMNAMYADYYNTAKEFGVDKPQFYASLAYAFMFDPDAQDNKVLRYYQHIVKK